MIITLDTGASYDLSCPIDISIPLRFNGPQPNAYGVESAASKPCEYGSLVGDTRRGGSCNFEQYTFIPHCSGTHTECVGHIAKERISVHDCLKHTLVPAVLISVQPLEATLTEERCSANSEPGDKVITASELANSMQAIFFEWAAADLAVIVRTIPNDERKLTRTYDSSSMPPYFTAEAISYLTDLGCAHLLVDLPSIDRLFDDGMLSNHRIFWNVAEGKFDPGPDARTANTITELIYVPSDVPDGEYLLNLQMAAFAADCSPSRPRLFRSLAK